MIQTTTQGTLETGQRVDGFLVRQATAMPGIRSVVYEIEHEASGARILHIHNDDSENGFSINFPTPPPDDTGLPHILEHCVLAGSRKYPVREPFFEMIKMSMATFINAMTGDDITYYPVCSNVRQDLFNLADVYFDAVFHPLLTEDAFQREGHHLAPKDPGDPTGELTVDGIVYNEMKGFFADPETRLYHESLHGLCPDTIYGFESGGDPRHIPELSYADFTAFHRRYYHPTNAYIVLYGSIPTTDYLDFLGDRLAPFGRLRAAEPTAMQPRWTEPRTASMPYPVGRDDATDRKTYVTINWLVGSGTDMVDAVAMHVLALVLFGHEAAPLKQAIVDSRLGEDLVVASDNPFGVESAFHVGLKGTDPDRVEAFEELTLKTLADLAAGQFDGDAVEAAFRQSSFYYLEIDRNYPLTMIDRTLSTWIYGVDPLEPLRLDDHLATVRRRYAENPRLFNQLIDERLLRNPHRLTLVLRPDPEAQSRTDEEFAERMRTIRAGLDDDEARRIAATAERLDALNGEPNSPAAVASLPQLHVDDLPREPRQIATTVETLRGGIPLLVNDVFANGVSYLQLDIDLAGLPESLYPSLPRYIDAIAKLGAGTMNYEAIAARRAAHTGGIRCWPAFLGHATEADRPMSRLRFSLKALDDQVERALDLLRDLLFEVDPGDRDRLRDVLIQAHAGNRTGWTGQGAYAGAQRHARRDLSMEGRLSHLTRGLPQLESTERLTAEFADHADAVIADIETIRDFLLGRTRWTAAFTGSDRASDAVRRALSGWSDSLRDDPGSTTPGQRPDYEPRREGLAGAMPIAHCAMALPAPHIADPDSVAMMLGSRLVSLDYILPEVRFKGNAYGAGCSYDGVNQSFTFSSYQDPHIARTLRAFAATTDFVANAEWSQTDIDRAIIGSAKDADPPVRPEDATGTALHRHLAGQTHDWRCRRYAELRAATPEGVKRALLRLLAPLPRQASTCVVSSRENLAEANAEMADAPLEVTDIPT